MTRCVRLTSSLMTDFLHEFASPLGREGSCRHICQCGRYPTDEHSMFSSLWSWVCTDTQQTFLSSLEERQRDCRLYVDHIGDVLTSNVSNMDVYTVSQSALNCQQATHVICRSTASTKLLRSKCCSHCANQILS